ncbi:response regulator [Chroococcidiopsis sp. FACHB-1243]|uniref:response regulator transcription factor n=1 Tax=Chroococcidiopsis sp. [FACHB-1243] TaxID=2692781 RepID=UPI001784C4D6|nr:response regulator [Chroococcidiopsis sp. [FACHB-1243]]MBD2303977.1 response regulator [Chroococcidiopsis sp. [FACHB-1243]]
MKKILVIEDERLVRDNILDCLEDGGYEVVGVDNGQVGLDWASEHKPDLILCDVMLPELDGYEVLRSLRQEPTTALLPFVFLSAKVEKAEIRHGMNLGADDYITKPFTPDELLDTVAARLKRRDAIVQYAELLQASLFNSDRISLAPQPIINAPSTPAPAQYQDFNAFAQELAALQSAQFTGKLNVRSATAQSWDFYLHQGRLLYATGGMHLARRWQRHVSTYCPQIQLTQLNLPAELFTRPAWEYQLLGLLLKQQQIGREHIAPIVRDCVVEVLFDMMQAGQVNYQKSEQALPLQLLALEWEQVFTPAQKLWQAWQSSNLTSLLPNYAPLVKQPEALQQQTSPAVYRQLTAVLDGKRSLRELAVLMKRQAAEVAVSLLPYFQSKIVELVQLPDLPLPHAATAQPATPPTSAAPATSTAAKSLLIACIDDSPLVCQTMDQMLSNAGYQVLTIQDPLRAISTLLTRKPDLIFLDLVMPNLNGYEISSRLRKIAAFRDTPIVILSGNAIDRAQAQAAGVSDYLEKPVQTEKLLQMIGKHIPVGS